MYHCSYGCIHKCHSFRYSSSCLPLLLPLPHHQWLMSECLLAKAVFPTFRDWTDELGGSSWLHAAVQAIGIQALHSCVHMCVYPACYPSYCIVAIVSGVPVVMGRRGVWTVSGVVMGRGEGMDCEWCGDGEGRKVWRGRCGL